MIQPNGKQDKIAFRYFVQDSETNLEAAVSMPEASRTKQKRKTDSGPSPQRIRSAAQTFSHALDRGSSLRAGAVSAQAAASKLI